jgi:small subunit ribosomal protein S1
VDLDGIDGLIHISELSWSHVNHPSEVISIGETVKVKVLDIDRDRQRISLGLRQTQADPWQRILETYNVGDILQGKVTKVVHFGAFVEILDGVEGLVHISELAKHHVENPREVVNQGDELMVKILEIDSDRRRLSLSIKRVEGQELPLRDLSGVPDVEGAPAPAEGEEVPDLELSEEVFATEAPQAEGDDGEKEPVEPAAEPGEDESTGEDQSAENVPAEGESVSERPDSPEDEAAAEPTGDEPS